MALEQIGTTALVLQARKRGLRGGFAQRTAGTDERR